MAISFTNTAGTGYTYSEDTGDTGTTDVPALATPSDAGNGKLLIGIWGAGADTSFSAQTPVLANVASTTEIINQAYAPDQVGELHCLYKLLASSPSNCNWNATPSANRKRIAAALIFDGVDTGSPIRSYAVSTGNSGSVVTFPDTSSASPGDVVLRVCQILKQDWSYTYNGTTVGTVIRNSVPTTYHDGVFYGYDTHSSGATPGTKTATWSSTVRWIAATIVIAAASGDTTAPVLTSPTGVATSSTAATVGATTDTAEGTMYGIASSSATVPTKTQIRSGQDHTGSAAAGAGNVAVSSTGAKTVNITGLTPGSSYYPHVVHVDVANNESNIVSGSQWTQLVKKVKLKLVLAAAGETVDGIVWANQAGGIAGAEIGEFTGQTIGTGSGADAGLAVLKVPVSVFGGGSLNVGDTVQVYVRKPDLSKDSDVFPATVIEE